MINRTISILWQRNQLYILFAALLICIDHAAKFASSLFAPKNNVMHIIETNAFAIYAGNILHHSNKSELWHIATLAGVIGFTILLLYFIDHINAHQKIPSWLNKLNLYFFVCISAGTISNSIELAFIHPWVVNNIAIKTSNPIFAQAFNFADVCILFAVIIGMITAPIMICGDLLGSFQKRLATTNTG